jgi:hypothetical protein
MHKRPSNKMADHPLQNTQDYIAAISKLQDAFAHGIPVDFSLVDELIADREAEALREQNC